MKPTIAQLEEENRHLEAENLRLSGELFTMSEKLGYYERTEKLRDEHADCEMGECDLSPMNALPAGGSRG